MADSFYILKGEHEDQNLFYGRVRIFINDTFINDKLNLKYNHEKDVAALRESFEKLGFKVDEPIKNQTAKEMKACFKDSCVNYFSCAVIFVLSHGEHDYIYGTDYDKEKGSGKIQLWKDLCEQFGGHKKSELQKCPKVFFIDCCQPYNGNECKHQPETTSCYATDHWLIYNAALPGYNSFLHRDEGSYSIQVFCQRLNELGQTEDLQSILNLVIKDVNKIRIDDDKNKDLYMHSIQKSTLHKKLYLLPEEKVLQLKNVKESKSTASSSEEKRQLKSTCTSDDHLLNNVLKSKSCCLSLMWNVDEDCRWRRLQEKSNTNTNWMVRFDCFPDYILVNVKCVSSEEGFLAVRVFAAVENFSHMWTEDASIVKNGQSVSCTLSKKVHHQSKITVIVRVDWSQLDHLSPLLWENYSAPIRYCWQLQGWKSATPTQDKWLLYSEPFGLSDAMWRIVVVYRADGTLQIWVKLQHLSETINRYGLIMNCTLCVWDQHFQTNKKTLKRDSNFSWTVVDDIRLESRDPLDLNVVIHIRKKNCEFQNCQTVELQNGSLDCINKM